MFESTANKQFVSNVNPANKNHGYSTWSEKMNECMKENHIHMMNEKKQFQNIWITCVISFYLVEKSQKIDESYN